MKVDLDKYNSRALCVYRKIEPLASEDRRSLAFLRIWELISLRRDMLLPAVPSGFSLACVSCNFHLGENSRTVWEDGVRASSGGVAGMGMRRVMEIVISTL